MDGRNLQNESLPSQERLDDIKKNIENYFSIAGDNIDTARDSKAFLYGDQWEEYVLAEYQALGRVALTINKIAPYQRRLSAEYRAATPAVEISPCSKRNEQNEAMANIYECWMRSKFEASNAKRAFQKAFDNATIGGFGAIAVTYDYVDAKSFDQDINILRIEEPATCGWDPAATNITKSDGDYCFRYYELSKDEFKKTYGFDAPDTSEMPSYLDVKFRWNDSENVTLVDYYEKEYFDVELLKLANGHSVSRKEYKKMTDFLEENPQYDNPDLQQQMEIVQKRRAKDYVIYNYVLVGDRILERKKFAGKELPIIYADGNSYILDGKEYTQAFIKDAMDAQRFENFVVSETVQNLKDSTKEDYLATPANIQNFEDQWRDKRRRKGTLLANPDPKTGQMPIKQPPSQINPQLIGLQTRAEEDIKSTLGIFDSNQGASSTDLSGKAENIRITQGNLSSFVYIDNVNEAVEQTGRVLLSVFRGLFNNPMSIQGTKKDGSVFNADINIPTFGAKSLNDVNYGDYKVAVKISSSFAAQRDQEYQRILAYASSFPSMQNVVQDLAAKALNSDISSDIAKRAQLTLPPEIQASIKDDPQLAKQGAMAFQQQQKVAQQNVQLQQMAAQQEIQNGQVKALSEKIDALANMMNAQTNRQKAEMSGMVEAAKLKAEEDRAMREEETAIIRALGKA